MRLLAMTLSATLLVSTTISSAGIEAYPIPTAAELSIGSGQNERFARGAPIPAPTGKSLVVVAPRNGVANGQILLKAAGGPATTGVTVSDLAGPAGKTIPAAKVQVRYGQYITGEKALSVYRWQKDIGVSAKAADDSAASYDTAKGYWRLDALLAGKDCQVEEKMPRCAWLTFTIDRDAAAGLYKGTATVAGADAIPIELEVVDAVVPDLGQSVMSNDIRPMWEVIAFGNGIPLEDCWKSERFWKMTAAYLARLGQLRMSNCGIAILAPSTTSSLGMVRWIRKGDNWGWDYTVLDRFIETYRKSVGEPRLLDATAFVHDEQRPGLSFLYTDAATGRQAVQTMGDDAAAAELASAFVKDLRAHLATLRLEKQLALGIWHDKMQHTGGKIRARLLADFPDQTLSLWAHSVEWGAPLKDRIVSYMSKGPAGSAIYPVKAGMRPAWEKPAFFGPHAWNAALRGYAGLGQIDFSNWSEDRRGKEYVYYGAGMFQSFQRHLVYPMDGEQVVTGVLYELFREYGQDYELIRLMQAKGVKTGIMADFGATMDSISEQDRIGRMGSKASAAKVDEIHHAILREAGAAKVQPEGK